MNWSEFTAELERIQRQFRIKSTKGIADLDAHHKQLSQSAAEIFAAMRDEAQIDIDHGNGAGDLVRRQVRTIREYLSSLDRIADALTSVEGDRQDAYENTPTGNWYSRGARNWRERKFNPNHDPANGRFTSGSGGASGAADMEQGTRETERDVESALARGDRRQLEDLRTGVNYAIVDGLIDDDRGNRLLDRIEEAIGPYKPRTTPPPIPGAHKAYC